MSPQWKNSNDKFNIPVGIILFVLFFFAIVFLAPHLFPLEH